MLHYAIVTFPGVVESDAYEHGLAWDQDISAAHRQEALGWKVTGSFARTASGQSEVSFIVRDRNGAPVSGLAVTCQLEYPADRQHDHKLNLVEGAAGEYRGLVDAREGGWKLDIIATQAGERVFRSLNRVTLH
jgi:nitrogen fixation protein FixH